MNTLVTSTIVLLSLFWALCFCIKKIKMENGGNCDIIFLIFAISIPSSLIMAVSPEVALVLIIMAPTLLILLKNKMASLAILTMFALITFTALNDPGCINLIRATLRHYHEREAEAKEEFNETEQQNFASFLY